MTRALPPHDRSPEFYAGNQFHTSLPFIHSFMNMIVHDGIKSDQIPAFSQLLRKYENILVKLRKYFTKKFPPHRQP